MNGWRSSTFPSSTPTGSRATAPPTWFADLEPVTGRPQWFDLELGIELAGRRVNLLPALLNLVGRIPAMARLESLFPAGGRPLCLPVGERDYVLMPPERLRILAGVLRELYGDEDKPVRFRVGQATALARLDEAFADKSLRWYGESGLRDRVRSLTSTPVPALHPPPGLLATLRPYQTQGLVRPPVPVRAAGMSRVRANPVHHRTWTGPAARNAAPGFTRGHRARPSHSREKAGQLPMDWPAP